MPAKSPARKDSPKSGLWLETTLARGLNEDFQTILTHILNNLASSLRSVFPIWALVWGFQTSLKYFQCDRSVPCMKREVESFTFFKIHYTSPAYVS